MGIPSYFSHFVREHRQIIKSIQNASIPIDNLYLDCNGFIYDAVNSDRTNKNEDLLIKFVCDKLIYYINLLKPSQRVFIAFDGVAPVAKLNQQRKRRYLSWYQAKMMRDYETVSAGKPVAKDATWNTAAITPGTPFMAKLATAIKARFANPAEFGLVQLKISCADEPGEGEHKLFEYIRAYADYHKDTHTVIYGLDADLIMLTLNHLPICNHLYLFRETPEFIKSIDNTLNPNELYVLDIPALGQRIIADFTLAGAGGAGTNASGAGTNASGPNASGAFTTTGYDKIHDYIFLFFLLGNDFLPHFPALNIRTQGINLLVNAYKHVLNAKGLLLTTNGRIVWKHFRLLIDYLQKNEFTYLQQEYALRNKQSISLQKRVITHETPRKAFEYNIQNLPMTDRATEQYINPREVGWENRYYQCLFGGEMQKNEAQQNEAQQNEAQQNEAQKNETQKNEVQKNETQKNEVQKKEICLNYLAGLEWTYKYYRTGCIDWQWTYKTDYPPLLADLIKYIPYFETEFLSPKPAKPVRDIVQLSYVLPKQSLDLLPSKTKTLLLKKKPEWYVDDCEFQWAFCKYFWEAHVKLPKIDIVELEKILI